jgi:hypothetical protein
MIRWSTIQITWLKEERELPDCMNQYWRVGSFSWSSKMASIASLRAYGE